MKDYLFRGRVFNTPHDPELLGKWVYGSLIISSLMYGNKFQIVELAKDEEDCDKTYEVYCPSIGQWTGMVDRDGAQIFEGDYLIWSTGEFTCGGEVIRRPSGEWKAGARSLVTILDICCVEQ